MTCNHLLNDYNVLGYHDITCIESEPFNALFNILTLHYKDSFCHNERIVLYTATKIEYNILEYIQQAVEIVNIDNTFILLLTPNNIINELVAVRDKFSSNVNAIQNITHTITKHTICSEHSRIQKPLPASFCILPWSNIKITSEGKFKPCCKYNDNIKDNNNNQFNISTDNISIADVYNSNEMVTLRNSLVKGELPKPCSVCWNLERNGYTSHRIESNSTFGKYMHDIAFELPNISNIKTVDIDLGITCNLKCRICSANTSSKILSEELKHTTSVDVIDELLYIKNNSNYIKQNNGFWDIFNPVLGTVRMIDFFGGEPFTIHSQVILLNKLINANYAKNVKIHYNTNGTFFPKNIISLWKNFKQVDIAFSIDDIEERFEYQRSGANWVDVQKNINLITTQPESYTFSVFVTVNIQNIFYLPELIKWYNTTQIKTLHFNILNDPDYLSIVHLSKITKKIIIDKLSTSIYCDKFTNIISLLYNTMSNTSKEQEFILYTLKIDKRRDEGFHISHKEFAEIINFN